MRPEHLGSDRKRLPLWDPTIWDPTIRDPTIRDPTIRDPTDDAAKEVAWGCGSLTVLLWMSNFTHPVHFARLHVAHVTVETIKAIGQVEVPRTAVHQLSIGDEQEITQAVAIHILGDLLQ